MKFKQLLYKWNNEGVINDNQLEKMLFDFKKYEKEGKSHRMISIVSTLGGLLLGVGIILFIGSNWEYLPKIIKLLLSLLLPTIPLVIGYFLIYVRQSHILLGRAMVFLGTLLIGASIAIIGQVYNTEANPRAMFGIWFVLSIPIIYLFRLFLPTIVSAVLFIVFTFFIIVDNHWWNDDLIIWIPYIYIIIGFMMFSVSEAHLKYLGPAYKKVSLAMKIVGAKISLLSSFILTMGFINEEGVKINNFLFGDIPRLFYNLVFVGILSLMFYFGNKKNDKVLINSAFIWTFVFIIFRYFDFFWDMLDVSIFFIFGGILLVGLSIFLEKKRKKMLLSFKK